uniref:NB-ARC domain-containing protein n=1 Tax=Arundo donax TaxID=35708 RepID=A0A0A9HEI1_ARUDO
MEWYEVYKSVGTGMENCLDVENMRNILSLSYYDLPSHLRTCLLYFSLFPEDYVIDNERLVWMWIAEGFIQSEKKRESLFELGESYFNELINRSMIQLVHKGCSDLIKYCRVHDMVLDLIHSLSSEENFVTILNDVHHTSPSKKVRRLSLQNGKVDHFAPQTTMSIQQVRSVVAFPFAINITPALQSFRILRVLDLQDSCLSESCNLNYLENLFHLRYLGLRNTHIAQLPEEIGNLRFLQTLDVKDNEITRLPSTVVQLRHLMCLRIEVCTRVPNGIGSLTSLEELSMLCIDDSTDIIEELGHLTQLRVLDISCQIEWNCILEKSLVKCLSKLQKIKSLYIWVHGECNLDDWITPQHLSRFGAAMGLPGCWFSTLPAWINSSLLLNLSFLSITVRELQQEDLEILGRLPALRDLHLEVDHRNIGILERFVFSSGSFPSLVHCGFSGYIGPFVFQEGAMPRIKSLRFTSHVREMREIADSFYLGLRNLPSLQLVAALFFSRGASKEVVEEAKAALRHEIEIHPNHPTLWIPS